MVTFFYARECPCKEECTPANFKSWQPWGWTEESCRAQVMRHLVGSGKHKNGEDRKLEFECAVEAMELETDTYDAMEHVPKRLRIDDRALAPSAMLCNMAPRSMESMRRHGGSLSADGSNPISRQDLKEVSDSLGRCVTSARHAQRLSAMAAKAFEDEAGIFEEVKEFVDAKISIATEIA